MSHMQRAAHISNPHWLLWYVWWWSCSWEWNVQSAGNVSNGRPNRKLGCVHNLSVVKFEGLANCRSFLLAGVPMSQQQVSVRFPLSRSFTECHWFVFHTFYLHLSKDKEQRWGGSGPDRCSCLCLRLFSTSNTLWRNLFIQLFIVS